MQDDSAQLTNPTRSIQLPSNVVIPEFGEVNVRGNNDETFVDFTILIEPQGKYAEGWRTGIALDASASMKRAYGRKVSGRIDPTILTKYMKKGLLKSYMEDGEPIRCLQKSAFEEIQQKGYVFKPSPNILQPLAQEFTSYLANRIDRLGKTDLIYWGCGKGDETEAIGEFSVAECANLSITGPQKVNLGNATKLMPAIAYFVDQYSEAKRGLFLFVTDGRIDDIEAVKQYTLQLAQAIAAGQRNFVKFILIGVGDGVDRYQLQELDDFDTGTSIDIWDYKIADEMQSLVQIFSEVVGEQQLVADRGAIYSSQGDCVKLYADGLPAKASFSMPAGSEWFELEVSGKRIRQTVLITESMQIVPLLRNTESSATSATNSWKNGFPWLAAGILAVGTAIAYVAFKPNSNQNSNPKTQANPETLTGQNLGASIDSSLLASRQTSTPATVSSPLPASQVPDRGSALPSSPRSQNPNNLAIAKVPLGQDSTLQPSQTKPSATLGTSKTQNLGDRRDKSIAGATSSNTAGNRDAIASGTGNDSRRDANSNTLAPDSQVILYFSADESSLGWTEAAKLNDFWAKIKNKKGLLSVKGYTDSFGDNAYNLELSNARAKEIVDRLKRMGLNENYKLTLEALGDLNPIENNTTDRGRALNRRVVVSFKAD